MAKKEQKYIITDEMWDMIQPMMTGQRGDWGGIARDNRLFLDALLYWLYNGIKWSALPSRFGLWNTVYRRYKRLKNAGILEKILEILLKSDEYNWIILHPDCEADFAHNMLIPDQTGPKYNHAHPFPWIYFLRTDSKITGRISEGIGSAVTRFYIDNFGK